MREIKFRAWDEDRFQYLELPNDLRINTEDWFYKISYLELQQYTGLKDKNGVEIYEGDVVETGYGIGVIEWIDINCCFKIRWIQTILEEKYSWIPFKGFKYKEVIGNIYENPELL